MNRTPTVAVPSKQTERRTVLAGTVGTILEWYDYGLYGTASALIFGQLFFSTLSPQTAVLASFATFGVGFLARPLGGIILGQLGDRLGRKAVLVICVALIAGATALMGCLPTFDQVGILAPVLLVVLRFAQGFGTGVELAASLTVVSEGTKKERRGFLTSIAFSGQFIGSSLASVIFLLMTNLPTEQFMSWGWRVPFLLSLVGLVFAIVVRLGLEESAEFTAAKANSAGLRSPLVEAWKHSRRNLLAGFLIPAGQLVCTYMTSTFTMSYISGNLGMAMQMAAVFPLVLSMVTIITIPIVGKLVDRFGARTIFTFGIIFTSLYAFPYFLLLNTKIEAVVFIAGILMPSEASVTLLVPQGKYTPTLFPAGHRLAGFAVSREFATALFAGPTPFIASGLVLLSGGTPWLVAALLIVAQLVAYIGLRISRPRDDNEPATAGELVEA